MRGGVVEAADRACHRSRGNAVSNSLMTVNARETSRLHVPAVAKPWTSRRNPGWSWRRSVRRSVSIIGGLLPHIEAASKVKRGAPMGRGGADTTIPLKAGAGLDRTRRNGQRDRGRVQREIGIPIGVTPEQIAPPPQHVGGLALQTRCLIRRVIVSPGGRS